jgi:hypothetical protein
MNSACRYSPDPPPFFYEGIKLWALRLGKGGFYCIDPAGEFPARENSCPATGNAADFSAVLIHNTHLNSWKGPKGFAEIT